MVANKNEEYNARCLLSGTASPGCVENPPFTTGLIPIKTCVFVKLPGLFTRASLMLNDMVYSGVIVANGQ